jgi:hypothetical protein
MSHHKKQLDVFKTTQNLQVSHLQIHGKDVTIFPVDSPNDYRSNGNSSGNHKKKHHQTQQLQGSTARVSQMSQGDERLVATDRPSRMHARPHGS